MRNTPPVGPAPQRAPVWRQVAPLLLTLAALVGAFWVGARLEPVLPRPTPAVHGAAGSVATLSARTTSGQVVPLAPEGGPSVVMVSSESCGSCLASMRDLAALGGGRPLPRLRVLSLEGAAGGERMVTRQGLMGVEVVGPVDGAMQAVLSLQLSGTPTFLLVDGGGRVRASLLGYPGREGLAPWLRVMTGERRSL
jgi:hypothetical protein